MNPSPPPSHFLPPPPPPHPPPSSAPFTLPPPPLHPHLNSFFHPSPPQPPYHPSTTTTTTTSPDLPTALSTLVSLINLSDSTLNTFSTLIPTPTTALISCPFNPNHRLPPSSLFPHFLQCSSSPSPLDPTSICSSLHYPHTLNPSTATPGTQPLSDSTADLTFSLENQFGFASNFFYSNCPGVVTVSRNNVSSPPLITLPAVLVTECADFSDSKCSRDDKMGDNVGCVVFFPSEIWAVRNEIEAWNDYPGSYSFRVLRAILVSGRSCLENFPTWVIVNSTKFGIVIDLAMRDHIVLLFTLCLRAIIKEAIGLFSALLSDEGKEKEKENGLSSKRFGCPVLGRVLMWLASQFAVLYGEMNGKFFAINMLKQCVLDASLDSLVFAGKEEKVSQLEDLKHLDGRHEESAQSCKLNIATNSVGGTIGKRLIFVSNVAAAVAALYERAMLEEKIRALRNWRPLSAHQRLVEHESISRIADEERQNRPNYRPLIDHDVLLRQQSRGQGMNKAKTREEILAEERDYKRRRMSYRGKKLKRSTTEVMRDIIEEYMEDIKQAGEIGCSAKGSEEVDSFPEDKQQKTESCIYYGHQESDRTERDQHDREDYMRSLSDQRSRHNRRDYSRTPDRQQSIRGREDYSRSTDERQCRYGRECSSRSPDRRSNKHDRDYNTRSPKERQDSCHSFYSGNNRERHKEKEKLSNEILLQGSDTGYRRLNERHHKEEYGQNMKLRSRHREKSHRSHTSASKFKDRFDSHDAYNDFDDRYNPLEAHDL